MFSFFKRNKRIPPFERLKSYDYQHYYFRRIASWGWVNSSTIFVSDPNSPRVITMDPWPQKIFIAADGQKTISEYTYEVAKEYRGIIPDLLDDTIINEIETLLKEKIIELHKNKMWPDQQNNKSK
ncbi:hypothetical protein [Foetidibacter luteolus]|uniref:hypothetical protein n=1 Tax=Foetidibacter luteolus TaxID=2608880 RepID=UPI00129A66E3|nr:hypothetical protein [Foetidibacter luteolus]